MSTLTYHRTAERPDIRFWLEDEDGDLIDLTGYTFAFKLGTPGSAATFTKTTGITGAVGSGTEPDGTPNVTMTFSAAELDGLTPGASTWQLRATTGGLDRIYQGQFNLLDVIT